MGAPRDIDLGGILVAPFVRYLFLALVILAIPAIVIAMLVARRGERTRTRMMRAIAVIAVLVLAGATFAARGVWDPAYHGGPFAAAALPAGIAAAASPSDPRRVSMIVMAVIIAFPLALLFSEVPRDAVLVQHLRAAGAALFLQNNGPTPAGGG